MIFQQCRAARALYFCRPEWLELALRDADLQRVIAAWDGLPEPIKAAVVTVVGDGNIRITGVRANGYAVDAIGSQYARSQ